MRVLLACLVLFWWVAPVAADELWSSKYVRYDNLLYDALQFLTERAQDKLLALDPDLEGDLRRLKRDAEEIYGKGDSLPLQVWKYACDVANNQQRNVALRNRLEAALKRARVELREEYEREKRRQP